MKQRVVCFGELLLRMTAPARERLLQSPRLEVYVGGAEANVAVSLAQLGHSASMVSVVPATPLGHACTGELRRYGVETNDVVLTTTGRVGLYFLSVGAGHRPSEVLYDRADSAFALAEPGLIDWEHALAGAQWFHVSGITAALGPKSAEAALRAVRAARAKGLSVSFDCNYRAKLWEAWDGDGPAILRQLLDEADLLFGDDRDIALILGAKAAEGADGESRFRFAAEHAFKTFKHLKRITATQRVQHSVDHHEISGLMMSREKLTSTRAYSLTPIVDRIGGGDAFAAGVLHGLLTGMDDQATLDFAVAAAVLKHSIHGDFNLVDVAEIQNLVADKGFAVKR